MKKIISIGFLILLLSQQQVFSQQSFDGKVLAQQLKEVNSQIMDTRIRLGEALIKDLGRQASYVQVERMKNIYRLTTEYQNFCDCEQRVLFMYNHTKEALKVYLSAYSRETLQKKKNDMDASVKNILKYSADLKDPNIVTIVAKLQGQIKEAQDLIDRLINFYDSENIKKKRKE